jgi:hypothetical protein
MTNTGELAEQLKFIILKHLARLEQYRPAHGRGVDKLNAVDLRKAFADGPVYSIFGLDSPEYIAAALAGGTITSIHRKLGDAFEECIRTIFVTQYNLSAEQVQYSAEILSGPVRLRRQLDLYLDLSILPDALNKRWQAYAHERLRLFSKAPKVEIVAIGFEVRHCYQSADSKRVQADEAMARHCLVSGILPVMLIFCLQSNRSVINRYRSLWVVAEGHESYELVKAQSNFDFYAFLLTNRETFRQPVIRMLNRLREEP